MSPKKKKQEIEIEKDLSKEELKLIEQINLEIFTSAYECILEISKVTLIFITLFFKDCNFR